MTLQTLSFIFGALLLLVGILGGGFEIKEVKIPLIATGGRVVSSIVGVVFITLASFPSVVNQKGGPSQSGMSAMEWDTDRFGADFTGFPLPTDNPKLCEDPCQSDLRCRAWTYVKPNTIKGPRPWCFLKEAVPPAKSDTCCVSGTKNQ
jgi:PAN domain